ncbi:MAG: cytochrome C oxidase subunit IV family protein [Ignavibacteriales bacterium]|nr:cytochrome C oxidase subunit IV family protein [Ignavibacteriales bacterium]
MKKLSDKTNKAIAQQADHQQHQIIGYGRYVLIWLGLLALTCTTVTFAGINLGRWIIITALTIASIKSMLMLNIFMHLKYEDRLFRIFVGVAIVTFIIFISLTFFDYAFY